MPETISVRTSSTHPLRIGRVKAGRGTIGMTICPGKVGPSLGGAPWRRSLELDLELVKDEGFDMILTLMEWNEMRVYGIPHMKMAARDQVLEWHHFQIPDRSVPNLEQVAEWQAMSSDLCRKLNDFGSLLIHCLGGLGRTGTAAAMLLQDMGMTPEQSISDVRAARPGAIENALQEDFVRTYPAWGRKS